jgi:hypothetical protein
MALVAYPRSPEAMGVLTEPVGPPQGAQKLPEGSKGHQMGTFLVPSVLKLEGCS